ncbi:protein O-mannosyl-transferase family [Verrucomicrobiota bacterium]
MRKTGVAETAAAEGVETASSAFFRKVDWSAFWTATVLSLAVYGYTLAPTVSLEDSGELAVAGDYLGVPHPPGYPIWTMVSWLFTKIFSFVRFRGQPNPAWSIGLLSAVFGSLAAGVSAMLICRSGSDMLRESRDTLHKAVHTTEDLICWVGAVVGSLVFAFSPVMWSQSVIVEVYSLNAFFLVLVFLLTYRWMFQPTGKVLYLTAFVFGLGLTNYQVLLLAALPLVVAVLLRDIKLFRDFLIVGTPYVVVILLMKMGRLPAIVHPTHGTAIAYAALNFLALVLAYFFLPRGKTVALTLLCVELGLAFYVYMPIVSDLRNPPMNWGYPRTWEGFKHAITRGQYEKIKPTDVFSVRFIHQIGAYLTDLRGQFTLPVALLGFLPFTMWRANICKRRVNALHVSIVLALAASAVVLTEGTVLAGLPVRIDKALISGIILILGVGALSILVNQASLLIDRLRKDAPSDLSERITIALIILGAVAGFLFYCKMLVGTFVEATAPLRSGGPDVPYGDVFVKGLGLVLLMVLPPLLAGLVYWLNRGRANLRVPLDDTSQKWVIATLLGFLSMSIMLIVLANPKGDIQDDFIQRVKFISSHALYAIWIGYGLIFGLASVDTLFKGDVRIRWLSVGTAMLLPLIPLQQNSFSSELIRRSGGAEQNGHDFGWQFGNYQLRGAEAVSEELGPDEEPLPNPSFPPEMSRDAIFYGGTDPGRFVPTYMIYSARVREDVYLITQNALADNTYMNVMRDLYGDRIWIPAQEDSARAFQRYVQEVRSGVRESHADLKIENGRVQVSGALAVMEINGILAQTIFEHNNYRHDFYVEESYVIKWMYPYLTPHGLIMKINSEKTDMSNDVMRDDMDFWDWYVRRLHSNPKFPRDVVARKSFSKLRSAIGGLYTASSKLRRAEKAFREARILYPLSPEANFRLVQEVFMRQRRFGESAAMMKDFGRMDSGNVRVPQYLRHVGQIERLDGRIRELEEKRSSGKIDADAALELAECYLKAQNRPQFLSMADSILSNTNLPAAFYYRVATFLGKANAFAKMDKAVELCLANAPDSMPADFFLSLAQLYMQANKPLKMAAYMEKYLERTPRDWRGWLDLAFVRLSVGQTNAAVTALRQATAHGGSEATAIIREDERFASIRNQILAPKRSLMGLPGVPGANRRR